MNKLLSLIKVTLKNSANDFSLNSNKKKKQKKFNIASYVVLVLVLLLFVCIPFGFMGYGTAFSFKDFDVNVYKIIIPVIGLIIPFLTLPFLLTNLFLNSTDEVLLSYPLNAKTIYTSRIFSSILQSYLFILMLLSPFLLGFLIGDGASFDMYLTFIVFTLLSPIIPLCFIGLIFTLLSKFINYKSHKNVLAVIAIIFPVLFAVGIQFVSNILGRNIGTGDYTQQIIEMINGTGNIFCLINFITIPFVISFSASSILYRLLFLLVSILITFLVAYLLILLPSKIYYKHMIKGENIKKSHNKVKEEDYKNSSIFKSLVLLDVKEILRNATYSMNYVFPLVIFPVIMIVTFLFSGGLEAFNTPEFSEIKQIINFNNSFVFTIAIAIILFVSSMSSSSITAISRLGSNSYFVKVIPVKPIKFILSRVVFGIVSTFITALLFIVFFAIFGILNILDACLLLIILIPFIILINLIAIYFDVKKPKLNWSTPNELVKNSSKVAIYIFSCWGGAMLLIGLGAIFTFALPINGYIICALTFVIVSLLCFCFYKKLNKPDIFKNF